MASTAFWWWTSKLKSVIEVSKQRGLQRLLLQSGKPTPEAPQIDKLVVMAGDFPGMSLTTENSRWGEHPIAAGSFPVIFLAYEN
jgi:hypothetical protein